MRVKGLKNINVKNNSPQDPKLWRKMHQVNFGCKFICICIMYLFSICIYLSIQLSLLRYNLIAEQYIYIVNVQHSRKAMAGNYQTLAHNQSVFIIHRFYRTLYTVHCTPYIVHCTPGTDLEKLAGGSDFQQGPSSKGF